MDLCLFPSDQSEPQQILGDEHVPRVDPAVHDPALVGVAHRGEQLGEEAVRLRLGEWRRGDHRAQRPAPEEAGGDRVQLVQRVQPLEARDVGVIPQRVEGPGLCDRQAQAAAELGGQEQALLGPPGQQHQGVVAAVLLGRKHLFQRQLRVDQKGINLEFHFVFYYFDLIFFNIFYLFIIFNEFFFLFFNFYF